MEFNRVLKRFMSINRDYIPSLLTAIFFLVGNQGLVAYINYTAGNCRRIRRMRFIFWESIVTGFCIMQR